MTDQITPEKPAEVTPIEKAEPKAEETVAKPEAPKVAITPEIQAIIDRAASEARKEGRDAALKKLESDDLATKFKAATEQIEHLTKTSRANEVKATAAEFGLDHATLDEFAEGLSGDKLRERAEKLQKIRGTEEPAKKTGSYKAVTDAVQHAKATTGTLSPRAQAIAAAAGKMRG